MPIRKLLRIVAIAYASLAFGVLLLVSGNQIERFVRGAFSPFLVFGPGFHFGPCFGVHAEVSMFFLVVTTAVALLVGVLLPLPATAALLATCYLEYAKRRLERIAREESVLDTPRSPRATADSMAGH